MTTVLTSGAQGSGTSTPPNPSTYGAITTGGVLEKDQTKVTVAGDIPPLGAPNEERRFWFQRAKAYDPDAIATLVRKLPIL